MKTITNDLKEYRLQMGFTQKEVIELIELSSTNRLSKWENGTSLPSVSNLFKLSYLYKTLPQKLYSELYTDIRIAIKKKKNKLHPVVRKMPVFAEKPFSKLPSGNDFETQEEAIDYLAKILVESYLESKRNPNKNE